MNMDMEKKVEAQELNEDELSQVSGAGRFNDKCPSCGNEGYTHVLIEVHGQQLPHRKCTGCGKVYRYGIRQGAHS